MAIAEKRKYPRVALKIEDGYFGNFLLANDEKLVAPIVNISAGGLNMAAPENTAKKIKAGDRILLISIAGGANFAFIKQIDAEIRWIDQSETPGYLAVGMEFQELAQPVREQMIQFVHAERMSRGQYD
jgi:c-di-GMP-binding flagellar brake protein YcgR